MGLQSTLGLLCMAGCVWVMKAEDIGVERRAPQMGFLGMRGKKDYDEKRTPSMGFTAMRGKKDPLYEPLSGYPEYKRASQMGFMGMRGKKDFDPEYDFDFGYEKRAPSMGFAAMRGKKAGYLGMRGQKFDYNDEDFMDEDLWPLEEFDKRAPASGFYGMRGKKQPLSSGFFGMRGKKGPSGFVGMRGKKVPSGFMGVRGKKDSSDDLDSLLELLNERQGDRSKRDQTRLNTGPVVNSQGDPETVGSGSSQ